MIRLSRRNQIVALGVAAVVVLGAAGGALWYKTHQGLHASLAASQAGYVRVNEPVIVNFDHQVDLKYVHVTLSPDAKIQVDKSADKLVIKPVAGWLPSRTYTIALTNVASSDHQTQIKAWKGVFNVQPRKGVAGYVIDGQVITAGEPVVRSSSKIAISFSDAMSVASVKFTANGKPANDQVLWAPDAKSAAFTGKLLPYQPLVLGVGTPGQVKTLKGDVATDLGELTVHVVPIEPSNPASGVDANYQNKTAMEVVVDNAGLARPQYGLQSADMVYEYVSEYSISRFTLIYFNNVPGAIGPVRSCRMINTYLIEAFSGVGMCSGASVGTLHYLFGGNPLPLLPTNINDFDNGNHYFRVPFKYAPHNLFTAGDRVERLRDEMHIGSGPYLVDPPHADNGLGQPENPPGIAAHNVSYVYDPGSQSYLPYDSGTPRTDENYGGAQVHVKNVVVMHVGFHDAGWVEDDNGGAHSVWYDMTGDGAAEIWSDGRAIHGHWHMGQAGTPYYANHDAPWFTDENGTPVELNSGLTWIHALGNGQ